MILLTFAIDFNCFADFNFDATTSLDFIVATSKTVPDLGSVNFGYYFLGIQHLKCLEKYSDHDFRSFLNHLGIDKRGEPFYFKHQLSVDSPWIHLAPTSRNTTILRRFPTQILDPLQETGVLLEKLELGPLPHKSV